MSDPDLEWDDTKAAANEAKHGVSFLVAGRVFKDTSHVEKPDPKHSLVEARFFAIGEVEGIVLTVVFTRRGKVVRIISARRASREERREYRAHEV
jgi:uncharacterized DUF497 family protein